MYVCEYVIYHFCILVHVKGIHVLLHTQQYVYMQVLSIIDVHIQSSTLNQTHCTHINILGILTTHYIYIYILEREETLAVY